jgi:P2-related tail formation protein
MNRTLDIAPSSITIDPQVQAACEAIDPELRAIYECMAAVPGGILFWPFADVQDETMTDVIAWEMHVDVWAGWDGDLSLEEKRTLINESIHWHQKLGTKWIVERMLRTVFRTGYIQEWYEYGGRPYYFRVIIDEPIGTPERLQRVYDAIIAVKNVRSWWEDITVPTEVSRAQMYVTIIVGQRLKNVNIPIAAPRT